MIDEEIMKIISKAYKRANQILNKNKAALKRIAEALLKYEALDAKDIKLLIEGKPLKKKVKKDDPVKKKKTTGRTTRRKQNPGTEGTASA